MMRILIVLFVALTFESAGVILLSKGLKTLEGPANYGLIEIFRLLGRGVTNKHIVSGVALEAIFFGGLLYMMSQADVSFVWPLTALTFVFATFAAKFYLHESIPPLRWCGVILIVCGAGLITYSEKFKERVEQPAEAARKI
jgi:drug/metabolite transporter (DMT)-like permease